jgi:hypothetical protein
MEFQNTGSKEKALKGQQKGRGQVDFPTALLEGKKTLKKCLNSLKEKMTCSLESESEGGMEIFWTCPLSCEATLTRVAEEGR